jgi:hypothetical protein
MILKQKYGWKNPMVSRQAQSWDYGAQQLFEHTTGSVSINEPSNVSGATL